jgi:predicted RNA-binding protein with PIN domain
MPDSYLIDGYNLIHAFGMIRKDVGPGGLEASRNQLLQFLADSFGASANQVTVVFDAKHSPRGVSREQSYQGISVQFAPKDQSADDLIEALIDAHAHPRALIVVSNDTRLQNAAARRGARAWSHEKLLDYFDQNSAPGMQPSEPANDKAGADSPEERDKWRRDFADLENDPELKEFFEQDRFGDE